MNYKYVKFKNYFNNINSHNISVAHKSLGQWKVILLFYILYTNISENDGYYCNNLNERKIQVQKNYKLMI